MMTSPNLEPIPTQSITVKLPEASIKRLSEMGKQIKQRNGVIFADPLVLAICGLLEDSRKR